eukprot:6213187-Pleurochrysis_carterae.AAC.5
MARAYPCLRSRPETPYHLARYLTSLTFSEQAETGPASLVVFSGTARGYPCVSNFRSFTRVFGDRGGVLVCFGTVGCVRAQAFHLCIINLVIGTLYCAKGNFEFGIGRVMKSLEPYAKKLGARRHRPLVASSAV